MMKNLHFLQKITDDRVEKVIELQGANIDKSKVGKSLLMLILMMELKKHIALLRCGIGDRNNTISKKVNRKRGNTI